MKQEKKLKKYKRKLTRERGKTIIMNEESQNTQKKLQEIQEKASEFITEEVKRIENTVKKSLAMVKKYEEQKKQEEMKKQKKTEQNIETQRRIMYDFQGPEILNPCPLAIKFLK